MCLTGEQLTQTLTRAICVCLWEWHQTFSSCSTGGMRLTNYFLYMHCRASPDKWLVLSHTYLSLYSSHAGASSLRPKFHLSLLKVSMCLYRSLVFGYVASSGLAEGLCCCVAQDSFLMIHVEYLLQPFFLKQLQNGCHGHTALEEHLTGHLCI